MSANLSANLWMASNATDRDALGTNDGVRVGDLCLLSGEGLYIARTVAASSSTWTAVARPPLRGRWSLAATAVGAGTAEDQTAISFQPELEAAPASVELTMENSVNWTALPAWTALDQRGFIITGTSDSVADGVFASIDGRYEVTI